MKKLLLTAALALSPLAAHAADLKVAVVDLNKLTTESKASKGLKSAVDGQREKFEKYLKEQETKLHAEDEKLSKEQGKPGFDEKRAAFDKQVEGVQKQVQERQEVLQNAFGESTDKIQTAILKIIGELAEKEKYSLVLPKAAIVFRADGLEITDQVLKALDDKLPSVDVKLPS